MFGSIKYNETIPARANRQKTEGSFFRPLVQPKLTVNQPNDVYEQQADAMAEKVMRMTEHESSGQSFFKSGDSILQRNCEHCEKQERGLQRKQINDDETITDTTIENYLGDLNGGGQ